MADVRTQFRGMVDGDKRVVDASAEEWERTYAMFTHLSLVLVHVTGLLVVIALAMWLIKRDQSPFVDDHGREAINFQISLLIYGLLIVPVAFLTCGVGAILYLPLYALGIIGMIVASIAAKNGQFYRYPMTVRFL